MTYCENEGCKHEAVFSLDHQGKIVFYCKDCFNKYWEIMEAIGSFIPVRTCLFCKTVLEGIVGHFCQGMLNIK